MDPSRPEPGHEPVGGEPLRALVGPTASGKTEFGLRLAERAGLELLSLDSMLVYRGLDVGTAKPTAAERARVPHHLIDLVEPHESYHVRRYLEDAAAAERRVTARGARPLYLGGTGLYLKGLLEGLHEVPDTDPGLRAELEAAYDADGGRHLMAELERVDAPTAGRIHRNDRKRLVRAHELLRLTGRAPSDLRRQWGRAASRRPHRLIGIAVEPTVLRERIERRTRAMLAAGWVEEVRAVLAGGGFGPTAAQALGYPEVCAHLEGELDADALERRIANRTWRFSRRQLTWYRGIGGVEWIDAAAPNAVERALGALELARTPG